MLIKESELQFPEVTDEKKIKAVLWAYTADDWKNLKFDEDWSKYPSPWDCDVRSLFGAAAHGQKLNFFLLTCNIDYILMLVKKFHDSHGEDKEVLMSIKRAVDASPELRSKKLLIESFIAGINDVDDVLLEWGGFVAEQKEQDLEQLIAEENLKPEETRQYISNCFRDGEIKTAGTEIDKLMPPVSRFGGGNRAEKKQGIIEKLKVFFEKYFGI